MLAQPLARRILRHSIWSHNYQLHLSRATRVSSAPIWQAKQSQIRTVRTARVPRSRPVAPPPPPVYASDSSVTGKGTSTDRTGSKQASESIVVSQEARVRNIEVDRLLQGHDEIVLYKAPGHGSLMIWSLLGGTTFSTMAFNTAAGIMTAGPFSLWLQVPTLAGCVLGLAMGFSILMTTTRQIQSVRLVRSPEKEAKLRFDTKWRVFFWEPKRIEVSLDEVVTDRDVRDLSMALYSVDLKDRFAWTDWDDKNPPSFDAGRVLRTMKKGMFNIWSTLRRDVGRMFLRQGMMIIRIEDKNWKMDMWHSQVLDQGKPFSTLVREDKEIKNSVLGIIRRQLSGS